MHINNNNIISSSNQKQQEKNSSDNKYLDYFKGGTLIGRGRNKVCYQDNKNPSEGILLANNAKGAKDFQMELQLNKYIATLPDDIKLKVNNIVSLQRVDAHDPHMARVSLCGEEYFNNARETKAPTQSRVPSLDESSVSQNSSPINGKRYKIKLILCSMNHRCIILLIN